MRMELSHKTQTATETPVIEYSPNDKEAAEAASSRINAWLDRVNCDNITTGTIRFDAFNANKESLTYV